MTGITVAAVVDMGMRELEYDDLCVCVFFLILPCNKFGGGFSFRNGKKKNKKNRKK